MVAIRINIYFYYSFKKLKQKKSNNVLWFMTDVQVKCIYLVVQSIRMLLKYFNIPEVVYY